MGILDAVPNSWGLKFECEGAAVTDTLVGPNSINYVANAYYFLITFVALPKKSTALNSDQVITNFIPAGQLEIVPQGAELFSQWWYPKHSLLIAIKEDRIQKLATHEDAGSFTELQLPKIGIIDHRSLAIAKRIRNELILKPFCYQASIDLLITLFSIYILRTYTSLNKKITPKVTGGLSARNRKRVLEFIYAHLSEKLTLERLASISDLSPSYFAHAFFQSLGQTPHEFIVAARLHAARELILTSKVPFGKISQSTGFANSSHMSAVIKKTWGKSPSIIRQLGG